MTCQPLTPAALLAALRERGVRVWLSDDRKLMVHPREAIGEPEWAALKEHKCALILLLFAELDEGRRRTRFRWPDDPPEVADCGSWSWTPEELNGGPAS